MFVILIDLFDAVTFMINAIFILRFLPYNVTENKESVYGKN